MKSRLSFMLGILMVINTTFAQAPDTLWSKIISISPMGDIDEGQCVRQTFDGGYIITGATVPNGMVSHVDVLLLKTDDSGNTEWIKSFGRDFFEEGLAVEQTSDGGYIIGGRSVIITDIFDYESNGWLIKTNTLGDTLWTKVIDGLGNDYFTAVQQTPDGGYILTGTLNSEHCYPDYEINELYIPGNCKTWLVKTDSNGDTLWTKTYLEKSHGTCAVQTTDGGYAIVGWTAPDSPDNQTDVLLIKTDSDGDTLWTSIIGGEDYDIGLCVRQTEDGFIISGQTKPPGSPYNALLIKTDMSGSVMWMNIFGGDLSDSGYSVEVTNDGGFFVTGTTNGTWWINAGDMWVYKTDSEGNLLWQQIYNLGLCDFGRCGIQTSDLGFVTTGLVGYGFGGDLWLAKFSPEPSAAEDNPPNPNDFSPLYNYPNPFNPSTVISFKLQDASFVNLTIYDIVGRKAAKLVDSFQTAGSHRITFDGTDLSSGIYFARLQTEDYVGIQKLLLVK